MPVVANVTAQPHESAEAIRARLVEQVTSPVRWEDSMRYLLGQGFTRFIELGPGTALSGFMKRIAKHAQILNVADLRAWKTRPRRWRPKASDTGTRSIPGWSAGVLAGLNRRHS